MTYRLVLTTQKVANARVVEADEALEVARTEWDSGKWTSVRLLTKDDAVYWKRGVASSADAEARERAGLASAAGLQRLKLDCADIGGLADLDAPICAHASSFEVRSEEGSVEGLLAPDAVPPRLRDLLGYLEERLPDAATLTGWHTEAAPGVNPAHLRLTVELSPGSAG